MAPFAIPEILRTPLESLFLQVKSMSPDEDVKEFLLKAIDPPRMEALDSAWRTLLDLGAVAGEAMTSRLTALGRHVSKELANPLDTAPGLIFASQSIDVGYSCRSPSWQDVGTWLRL